MFSIVQFINFTDFYSDKKKLLVFIASLLNIMCGKTFFLVESMMQKSFKSLFIIHSLQKFVVNNQNIQLKKPHHPLFFYFYLFYFYFFFEAISWPVKYDYVMFSLARSKSEFVCSPAKKGYSPKNRRKAAFSGTEDIPTYKQPLR